MWRNFVADFCSLTGQGDCVHCNKTALFFPYYGGNLISYDNRRLEETDVLHIKHRMGQEDKDVLKHKQYIMLLQIFSDQKEYKSLV